jgi:hypothetical protein
LRLRRRSNGCEGVYIWAFGLGCFGRRRIF